MKDATPSPLLNGDIQQTASSSGNSGPPVVSITSGKPFMEAPNNSGSKQSAGNVSTFIICSRASHFQIGYSYETVLSFLSNVTTN